MITRRLLRLRLAFPKPRRTDGPVRLRRRSARRTLACGLISFVAACAALSVTLDSYRVEWLDPEFGHRLNQIRALQAKSPDRPLLLFVGTSRTQMAISPSAMGFPDEPGSPQPYNLGYRSAGPSAAALNVFRVIDAGHTPAAVFVEFAPQTLMARNPAHEWPAKWPGRLSYSDLARIRELGTTEDGTPGASGSRAVWATAAVPWAGNRLTLMSHWFPEWVPLRDQRNRESEAMDGFGFRPPFWVPVPAEHGRTSLENVRKNLEQSKQLHKTQIHQSVDLAYAALIRRCQALRVRVVFVRNPESPAFRSWYSPECIAATNAYASQLIQKYGVTVFPGPEHLEESDFADGFHMYKHGAERYSRWLADTHIKPWIASGGLKGR
ncbi:MAG: hypothetical protein C0467_28510 [Planctomycetaceae bacterium]|nr:hypothetical protein [Planctomycetaceae bacterium]